MAIHGDDIIAEREPKGLDRLDEVLKKLVVVKVLDRLGPGAAALGQYLKKHVGTLSDRDSSEWKIRKIAAIIRNRSKMGAKPQSSPGGKDLGKPIQKHWMNWKRWKQSCTSKIQGSGSTCQVGNLTYSST